MAPSFDIVLLLSVSALLVTVQCAEVTHPPSSVNVSFNSMVKFTCRGIGDSIAFSVDNLTASDSSIMARGFMLVPPNAIDGIVNGSLIATATEANNNTNIICTVITIFPLQLAATSPPAVLMIQGILDGVGDLMATVIDGSSVSLTWTPPYSLDNVPITGYNIITSDGINITVNTPYHTLTSSDPDPCNITTVSVGAINDVGTSQYNNVSFYYQRAPPHRIVSITNGSRDGITVVVDLSSLCVGERPNSITINVTHFNDTVNKTDISSISMDQLTIHHMITLQNDWIEYFVVNVTLSNRGGETSYPFPFGNLGPVNNITSSSTNCSIINVSWSRPPSVHDRVNIHNYTLRRYNDNELVSSVTINGNTTSYEFVDEELFSHEYTYEICGNNELGEGNCSNGTFSYLRVPTSVRNDTTFTLLNDTIIYFNIPFIKECEENSKITINISLQCDVTVLYSDGHVIGREVIDISGNITIVPSQYESCQLSVMLTNTNGISTTYIISLVPVSSMRLPTPTVMISDTPPSGTSIPGIIIGIIFGCSILIALVIVAVLLIVLCYMKRNKSHEVTLNVRNVTVDNDYTSPMRLSTLRDNQMRANEECYHLNEDNDHEVDNDDHQDPDEWVVTGSISSWRRLIINSTNNAPDETTTSSQYQTDSSYISEKIPYDISDDRGGVFLVPSAAATTAAYSGNAIVMEPPIQRVTTTLENTSGSGDYNRSSSDKPPALYADIQHLQPRNTTNGSSNRLVTSSRPNYTTNSYDKAETTRNIDVTSRNNTIPSHIIVNEQTSSTSTYSESADLLHHQRDNTNIVIYETVQLTNKVEHPIAPPSAVEPVVYSSIDHMRQALSPHANRPMSTVTVLPSSVSEDTPPAIPAKRRQDKPSSSDDTPLLPGQVNNKNTTTTTDDNATTTSGPTLNT